MKKAWMVLMAGLLAATMAFAATPEKGQAVTYPQLAELLVKALGLTDSLPVAPTTQQLFDVLELNGISPMEGWTMDSSAAVNRGDLARVLVQAMGLQDDVANPTDPNSWIKALSAAGISLDSMADAVGAVDVLPDAVTHALGGTSTDPLIVDDASHAQNVATFSVKQVKQVITKVERSHKKSHPVNPTPH